MNWKEQIRNSIKTIDQLEKLVALTESEKGELNKVIERYPMQITPYYASLIDWTNPEDQLRKKVVPSTDELKAINTTDTDDSYEEQKSKVLPGLEHKYNSTALLLVADACASYCRECFRKTFVSKTQECFGREVLSESDYGTIIDYLRAHKEIDDVLITGGEPLLLSNKKLDNLLEMITSVESVKKVRIGTKIPAYLPQRITEDKKLVDVLEKYADKVELRIIAHYNHPRELTDESRAAIKQLKNAGMRVYNQTALLKGINDTPEVLRDLLVELDNSGIIPYYVFERMTQKGTAHLGVPTAEGFKIFDEAISGLEGTAQTAKYVIPKPEGKLQVLDVYEKDGMNYARVKYLKTAQDYAGPKSFEMKLANN